MASPLSLGNGEAIVEKFFGSFFSKKNCLPFADNYPNRSIRYQGLTAVPCNSASAVIRPEIGPSV